MTDSGVTAGSKGMRERRALRLFKMFAVSLLASAFVIPLVIVGLPFIEFLNGMAAQPKAKAQGTYGRVFGESRLVARPPVDGTVPRSGLPSSYEDRDSTIEEAKAVGGQLVNPVALTRENLEAGRERYRIFCQVCHGERGEGDGSVVGLNRFPAPPSQHTDQARGYADGTIWYIITRGVGKMPGYADQLEPVERWQVVHYVRALQRAMNPQAEDVAE